MWVIFRDHDTALNYPDKHVFAMVADEDILAYQAELVKTAGGRAHELMSDVYFLQPLVRSKDNGEYFARRYKPWVAGNLTDPRK